MPDISTEVAIATTTLGSAAATINFTSISSAYTDLRVVLTTTGLSSSDYIYMRYNATGSGGSAYSSTHLYGGGASAGSYAWTSTDGVHMNGIGALGTTPNVLITADIFSYAGSTFKTCLNSYSSDNNGSGYAGRLVGLWRSTAAITQVSLLVTGSNFNAGTTATLYGIL
jgi:hypothetical protein